MENGFVVVSRQCCIQYDGTLLDMEGALGAKCYQCAFYDSCSTASHMYKFHSIDMVRVALGMGMFVH